MSYTSCRSPSSPTFSIRACKGNTSSTFRGKGANLRRWAVEDGNRMAAIFAVAVCVGNLRPEQSVGLFADLMGRAVIHAKRLGPAADIYSERPP